ncbi:DUF4041 domain-containing protein [Bittarella massiliensis (ex Durand et al. 2017)]|nr:DUF4041 domain-containing protein [Bittarella massiliensis (ex Durand et al. 2017)]
MGQCVKCGKKGLTLKVNVEGMCPECSLELLQNCRSEIKRLRETLSPEHNQIEKLKNEISRLQSEKTEIEKSVESSAKELRKLSDSIQERKTELIETDEKILLQEFGLYEPRYDFVHSEQYKIKLDELRKSQKAMIKAGTAVTGSTNWTVNNSVAQGRKMVKDMQKLLLRAFNGECDSVIEKVKYNNYESSLKRLRSSKDAISKLGSMMGVSVAEPYYISKVNELTLALEYQQKKQQEKEEMKETRARMREEAKLQKEIAEARKKAEKEKGHYENALAKIESQIKNASESELPALLSKKEEIESHLGDVEKSLKDIDYREANQRAGYVYVISNVGSFGENVYKIGMTRRLDPMERVDELGDASVPFNFDVHAMIFSDDAPALEAALHNAFSDRKLNMVNQRREFFNVSLDEIRKVVQENYDKTVEFIELPPAEQYRISLKMKQEKE